MSYCNIKICFVYTHPADQAVLAFERSTYVGTEAGPVEVCVVALQRLNLRDVEFTITSTSGSAFSECISLTQPQA